MRSQSSGLILNTNLNFPYRPQAFEALTIRKADLKDIVAIFPSLSVNTVKSLSVVCKGWLF